MTMLWYFIPVYALQTQVSTVVWTQSICKAHGYGQAEANEKRGKWRSWTIQRGDFGSCKEHPHLQFVDFFYILFILHPTDGSPMFWFATFIYF